jgi:hypothetical protein
MFDAMSFDDLLSTPDLGSRLIWAQARQCACFDADGGANVSCLVCSGSAYVWEDWSEEFRAGLVGLSGRQIANLSQRFGPGMVGDGTISLSQSAPPYSVATQRDRFVALDALDTFEWPLAAGVQVKLPVNGKLLEARLISSDGTSLVRCPVPVPDSNGRISVSVSTVVRLQAPRRYEVIADLSQVRSITLGLPRKVMVKLIDVSVRW